MAGAGMDDGLVKGSKWFFFEKKNQKTFINWRRDYPRPSYKSLFASFSSEKEDSFFTLAT
jgi:hypothetical protein